MSRMKKMSQDIIDFYNNFKASYLFYFISMETFI